MDKQNDQEFATLLEYLKRNRSFDFTGYKPGSLIRRIQKRMHEVDISSFSDYIDYLEVHPDEFVTLFNTILINVTGFFRDPAAWEFIEREIIADLLDSKKPDGPVRVWSTGCASGEEAYSLAILLAEALGEKSFRERVKIYATDVDEEALNIGRLATYSEKVIEGVPPDLLDKYFSRTGDTYSFSKELRRCIIFGRNDLIQDAPISRIDLLVCRNTLMYFNAETQQKILARFHFALNDAGYLFLGKAETLLTRSNLFSPVDVKLRLFRKIPRANLRDQLLVMGHSGDEASANHLSGQGRVRDAVFNTDPVAQIVVDLNNTLIMANERARSLFSLWARDIGRPLQDLEISYRPLELRSVIQESYAQQIPTVIKDVAWPSASGEERYYDVRVHPLFDNGSNLLGTSISFINVSQQKKLQMQLEQTNHELETAFEELQSTNEELETTNEELQSTIEELETTNEELQSTNEELETMNEELQSTNEELSTINDELRQRTEEVNDLNDFMESILVSIEAGILVLDPDLRILVWNRKMDDLWGLRAEEVLGHNFLSLDIGLPVEQLKKTIRACLSGEENLQAIDLKARDRRGREITCGITCTPRWGKDKAILGVIVAMEEYNDR